MFNVLECGQIRNKFCCAFLHKHKAHLQCSSNAEPATFHTMLHLFSRASMLQRASGTATQLSAAVSLVGARLYHENVRGPVRGCLRASNNYRLWSTTSDLATWDPLTKPIPTLALDWWALPPAETS